MAKKTGKAMTKATYRELRDKLDDIMAKLQDPACDVDQAAELYEQALTCIGELEHCLRQAENRVEKARLDFTATLPTAADRNGDGLVD